MLNALRKKRLDFGITQIGLYYKSGVPTPYISLHERGYPVLKLIHKERIAKALGTTVEELFPESR